MKRTDKLLQNARFSKRYQGYHYLLLCVELASEDESRLCSLIKQIYQPVADQYQLTYQDIERNIRTARDYAWQNGGKEFIEKISGGKFYEPPAVGELIEILAGYLNEDN